MDLRAVAGVLGYFMLIIGGAMAAPLAVAIGYDSQSPYEAGEVYSFLGTLIVIGSSGWLLIRRYGSKARNIGRREGFAVVSFGWLGAVLVGTLPFLFCGVMDFTDAFFEVMSGFTTTGATILGKPGITIEDLPHGLQFWRCMTQWLGGMGIVVLSVALLSFLGVGGYHLLKAETPGGVVFEKERPRISEMAKQLWILYVVISALQVVAMLLAGTTLFDALCHTFTTMSTGGFSPHTESLAYFSPAVQWIVIVFMFAAGMNFSLHARLVRLSLKPVWKNPEFRLYLALILGFGLLAACMVPENGGLEPRLRHAFFQVVSIGTTTGYATKDFDRWPQLLRFVLLLAMLIGGCMGSTGGGMKVARVLVYAKVVGQQLHRLVFPHAVRPVRLGERVLDGQLVNNILAFGTLYVLSLLCGFGVMAACGYDVTTSLSASAAALGNIGPGLGAVGPAQHWGHLPAAAKWVMSLLMLLGRLELYSVVILFTPWCWKR